VRTAILLVLLFPSSAPQDTRPPNLIFILADDLGWTDVACQGSRYYETPAIDRLAAQGIRLTSYAVCQNCAPTRAAIMSGQYPPRTGVYTVGNLDRGAAKDRKMEVPKNETQLPIDRVTLAQTMKSAGYATAMFGKWHLGQKAEYHPSRRGFDEAIVSMGKHFDFVTDPKVPVPPGAYLADFLTDRAVEFIEKNRNKPFFLYLPHFGVHVPHEAKPELIEKYRKKAPVGGHHDPTYAAMIESVDQSVGRIVAKLDELKLAGNTIVLFSSDNGGVGGYNEAGVQAKAVTDNAPLRGGKGMLYEGGVRVPFILRWPGVVTPGTTSSEPAVHVDLYPTFCEISGAKRPEKQALDGVSLLPLLRDPSATLGRDAIYSHFPGYLEGTGSHWRTPPAGTIRSGDWKLHEFFEDGRLELYNLKDDPGERKDLAASQPEKARELRDKLAAWRSETGAAMPRKKE
jgi:arylsulfatase A-like enzyme